MAEQQRPENKAPPSKDSMVKSPHQYEPLKDMEIRVLVAEDSSRESWHFEYRSLDESFRYFALSYCWGQDHKPRAAIAVEGTAIELGDNANELLQSLRAFDHQVPIWIDALCIDQTNSLEKSQQIPLMGRVYSQAEKVLVYLGSNHSNWSWRVDDPDELDLAGVIEELSKMEVGDPRKSHLQFNRGLPKVVILNQNLMCSIMTKDWWSRLWTMQEYVLAQEVVFLYGDRIIEDAMLREYIDLYQKLNLDELEILMTPDHYRFTFLPPRSEKEYLYKEDARVALPRMQFFRSQLLKSNQDVDKLRGDLCILTSTFDRMATVAGDKILGVMGILQSSIFKDAISTAPDATPQEIFTSIARRLLTNDLEVENLALLHYIDPIDELGAASSWVPNFQSRTRALPLSPFTIAGTFLYCASSESAVVEELDGGVIKLKGMIVDYVDQVVDYDTFPWHFRLPPPMEYHCAQPLAFEKACRELSASVAMKHAASRSQIEASVSAYCETLVAGSRREGVSYGRWSPGNSAYRKWISRMTELSNYSGNDWLHLSRNPGAKVSKDYMDFLQGKGELPNEACEVGDEAVEFHQRFDEVCKGRKFFSTRGGTFGLGPNRTEKADIVVVFCGGRTPFIIRQVQEPEKQGPMYRLIGETYVHGFMDGEASGQLAHGERTWSSFQLV